MDGLLRYGGGHHEASGGRIPVREHRAPASGQRANRPYPETPGEGSVPLSLHPRTRIPPYPGLPQRDPEEVLAHDDERRDVEDEVGGQIMKVEPVVKHKPTDGWVEGKSQSVDKMREEHYPLLGFQCGDDLPFGRKPVRDVCGQVSGLPKLRNVLLRDGGGHPLASHSGHAWNGFTEKVRTWALELERGRMDEQRKKKAWV